MDRPELDGVFDLQGYTSQVNPHPTEDDMVEVTFFDGHIPIGGLTFHYDEDEVVFDNLNLMEAYQSEGILTAIIAETPRAFRKAGFKTWVIETNDPDHELSQMYQNLGFQYEDGRLQGKMGSVGKLERTAQSRLKKGGIKP